MSDTTASLGRKIGGARDLQSVVRSMKALAASSMREYEQSVSALAEYFHTVELGLRVCLRESDSRPQTKTTDARIGAVVFGSDQGLVGRFNEELVDYTLQALARLRSSAGIWAVGERIHAGLADKGLTPAGLFPVPNSVNAITPLVGRILGETEALGADELQELHLFYNRPGFDVIYTPVSQRLLPLDETWRRDLTDRPWPTNQLPEVFGGGIKTLRALIREYLFISLFRACTESLASENGARLAAMQRAEKNIEELLEELGGRYHRLRQSGIDEELSDVISGFEILLKRD